MELRLWATKERPVTLSDYVKGWKTVINLDFFKYGLMLSAETFYVLHEGGEYRSSDHIGIGAEWTFKLGYSCAYYDGYWKRISLGPLFVTWWSPNGEET